MTPTAQTIGKIQKSVIDLNTMEETLIGKTFTFTPVTSTTEALERVGGDAKKFLDLINEGLFAETRRAETSNLAGYNKFDAEGDLTNVPFDGIIADAKVVNTLVLQLAKTVFGYKTESPIAERNAAKDAARDFIKGNPVIRENLKKSAALAVAAE